MTPPSGLPGDPPTRPLGHNGRRIGRRIERLALGCAPIANLGRIIKPEQASQTINAAWDSGVRYFDVAPHYGLRRGGARLGQALAARPRDEFIIFTKVGRILEEIGEPANDDEGFAVTSTSRRRRDYSRDGVTNSIEDSLTRFGMDRMHLVIVHEPDDFFTKALTQTLPALEDLRQQGVIRSCGAGIDQANMPGVFVQETPTDVMMRARRYAPIDRAGSELLDRAAERDVPIVAAGIFNSGPLAPDAPSASDTFDHQPVPRPPSRKAAPRRGAMRILRRQASRCNTLPSPPSPPSASARGPASNLPGTPNPLTGPPESRCGPRSTTTSPTPEIPPIYCTTPAYSRLERHARDNKDPMLEFK